uniref:Uncharacterized protein n=1 Tax=Prymnesium polylepis TaxID=72548 RepID=A0A7S4IF62_9EUKA
MSKQFGKLSRSLQTVCQIVCRFFWECEDGGGDGGQVGGEWCEGGDYGEGAVGEGVLLRGVGVGVRVGGAAPGAAVPVWHGAYIALCEGGLTEHDLEYGVALVL